LDTAALEASLANINLVLDFAIGSIVLGLVLEYAPEFWSKLSRITPKWLEKVGEILVIAGVASELALHIRSGQIEDSIKSVQRKALAELHDRATKAELELAKIKLPRSLTSEQQVFVVARLKPFSGQEYALAVAPGSEPVDLLCTIDAALKLAGWIQIAPFGIINVETPCGLASSNNISGVRIQVASGREAELRDKVIALAAALQVSGIVATPVQIPKSEIDKRPTAIQIAVGLKPAQ
jgi:hypothetical protein